MEFKISKKAHNKLIPLRKIGWKDTCIYIIKENDGIYYERYPSLALKIFSILIIIPSIFMDGAPTTFKALKELYFPKKYDSYISEMIISVHHKDYNQTKNNFLKYKK